MAVEPQRVVLIHRFFSPDVTTYAQMLHIFARHLVSHGHQVTVVCGPPSYNGAYTGPKTPRRETVGGVEIVRLRSPRADTRIGKLAGTVLFPVLVILHLLGQRVPYDVVSVTTVPPVLMGVAGRFSRLRHRKARLIYHCMDLYPEVAQALGVLDRAPIVAAAKWLDSSTVRAADRVIVLSEDMRDTLLRRPGCENAALAVANNFILADALSIADDSAGADKCRERIQFVFAGNLGRFQGLECLVEAVRILAASRSDFEVVFLGAGVLAPWLSEQSAHGALPLQVQPHRPLAEAMPVIAAADCAIVSLAPDVIGAAYPSKLLMYLELGRPVLAVVESSSELAELVSQRGLGAVAEPGNAQAVADAMATMIDTAAGYDSAAVRATGREYFGRRQMLDTWQNLYGLGEAA